MAGARLYVLVFFAGACTLGAELTAARLLAPFFGTSTLVWANVIGMTLLYLALGYWLGGKLADRWPEPRRLAGIVVIAAITIALFPFVTRPLFEVATTAFAEVSSGVLIGSFIAVLLAFAIPITALGTVAPWALRLAVRSVEDAGTIAGRLYALSTVGSLVGTFGSVIVLVPTFGARRTMFIFAFVLALSVLPLIGWRAAVPAAVLGLLLFLPEPGVKAAPGDRVVWEGESAYQFIQVVEDRDGDRVLRLNEGWAVHSIVPGPSGLVGNYWDAALCLPVAIGREDAGRLAVLGNAAGTSAIQYARFWPGWTVDGVEVDGKVTEVGYRYMGMEEANLTVHTADARPWIARDVGPFDAIIVDAYHQPYIPFHLVTREFFSIARDRLTPGGILAINVGSPPGYDQALDAIAGTMAVEFPVVEQYRINDFNTLVVAYRDAETADLARERLAAAPGALRPICADLGAGLVPVEPSAKPLTDDDAPVERLTDSALFAYIRDGAPGAMTG